MNADPRKETFLQMLYQTFCPTLTWHSFITLVTLVDSLVMVATVIGSFAIGGLNNSNFLGTNNDIIDIFDRDVPKITQKYQIYRLLTAVLLHTGFSHYVMNMLTQIIFGSWLEAMIGFRLTAMTYVVSG